MVISQLLWIGNLGKACLGVLAQGCVVVVMLPAGAAVSSEGSTKRGFMPRTTYVVVGRIEYSAADWSEHLSFLLAVE